MPVHVDDETLLGGLDLAATLATGRPVHRPGLLAQTEGGVLLAAMAERLSPERASRLVAALDGGASLAVLALDEGHDDDETPPAALLDRLALQVRPGRSTSSPDVAAISRARNTWQEVVVEDGLLEAVVAAASGLGIVSARAACHALTVTRIAAALAGRSQALPEDAALAARLVLGPRATQLPAAAAPPVDDPLPASAEGADADEADEADDKGADDEALNHDEDEALGPPPERMADQSAPVEADVAPPDPTNHQQPQTPASDQQALDDQVAQAALASIPPGLLSLLQSGMAGVSRRGEAGRAGAATRSQQRGRPLGAVRGEPRGGARLALVATLRAAAPWQRARHAALLQNTGHKAEGRVLVARDDLRIQRRVQRRATTTIFAIDASGSQALHRLAEAKGAVELLLADCYARRDRVAVIGFRGAGAQLLLAPTRSLVRARRQLAGLPGGGGTPLAAGIDAVTALAGSVRRGGATPLLVLLTDGRANIARDGTPGRGPATLDALQAARVFSATGTAALLIDTSPQRSPAAQTLADALRARCIVLPAADATALSTAVRQERGGGPQRHA